MGQTPLNTISEARGDFDNDRVIANIDKTIFPEAPKPLAPFPIGSPEPKEKPVPVKVSVPVVKVQQTAPLYVSDRLPDDNVCVVSGKKYFPESQWPIMKAVLRGESHGNPNSNNPAGYYGCFQIDNYPEFNPDENARLAFNKYQARIKRGQAGWSAWGVYNSGLYLRWL